MWNNFYVVLPMTYFVLLQLVVLHQLYFISSRVVFTSFLIKTVFIAFLLGCCYSFHTIGILLNKLIIQIDPTGLILTIILPCKQFWKNKNNYILNSKELQMNFKKWILKMNLFQQHCKLLNVITVNVISHFLWSNFISSIT